MTQPLQQIIDNAWEDRANVSATSSPKETIDAIEHVIDQLDKGQLRVATRQDVGQWTTHQWIKKAVLLSFRLRDNSIMRAGDLGFYDKVQTKFADLSEDDMRASGVRVTSSAKAATYHSSKMKGVWRSAILVDAAWAARMVLGLGRAMVNPLSACVLGGGARKVYG